MNRFTFIFLVCIYALFLIYQAFVEISIEYQLVAASILILLFGIPHGAIDHILFFRKRTMSQLQFYSIYLGLIVCFVVLWLWQPLLSFVLFLLLSAYHFGESQLVDIRLLRGRFKPLIYFNWGLALLATLVYYNSSELIEITAFFQDTEGFASVYNKGVLIYFFLFANAVNLGTLIYLYFKAKIAPRRFFSMYYLANLVIKNFNFRWVEFNSFIIGIILLNSPILAAWNRINLDSLFFLALKLDIKIFSLNLTGSSFFKIFL